MHGKAQDGAIAVVLPCVEVKTAGGDCVVIVWLESVQAFLATAAIVGADKDMSARRILAGPGSRIAGVVDRVDCPGNLCRYIDVAMDHFPSPEGSMDVAACQACRCLLVKINIEGRGILGVNVRGERRDSFRLNLRRSLRRMNDSHVGEKTWLCVEKAYSEG